ncbi:hypothetical protein AWB71_04307 [Caballeronia peredens]|nr:hypothetical protein AWB71_04307 [Caballeronia peredens]
MTNLTTAYQCDERGVLVGAMLVQEDPLNVGTFLLPPGVTPVEPPQFDPATSVAIFAEGAWTVESLAPPSQPETMLAAPTLAAAENRPAVETNQIAVIGDGQWKVRADFRGTTYWLTDGTQHVIEAIGETPPEGALFEPPTPPCSAPTLTQMRAEQGAKLQAAYQRATQQPVTFTTAAGATHTFQTDIQSQLSLLMASQGYGVAGSAPNDFYWLATDNTKVPFTLADLNGLYAAMLAQNWAAFAHWQCLKNALNAATSENDVLAIEW